MELDSVSPFPFTNFIPSSPFDKYREEFKQIKFLKKKKKNVEKFTSSELYTFFFFPKEN